MRKFLVRGSVPKIGPIAMEVMAWDCAQAIAMVNAMFGGQLTSVSTVKLD